MPKGNWRETWLKTITSNRLNGRRIPLYENTDRDALLLVIRTCGGIGFAAPRVVRIRNTLCLGRIQVSEALYADIRDRPDEACVSGPRAHRL